MVPTRLATYGASPKIFRGCRQDGTTYHIWWQCPKVRRFWIRVYNLIFTLTQINLIKPPKHALLGLKVDEASKNQRRLLTFIFIAEQEGQLYCPITDTDTLLSPMAVLPTSPSLPPLGYTARSLILAHTPLPSAVRAHLFPPQSCQLPSSPTGSCCGHRGGCNLLVLSFPE